MRTNQQLIAEAEQRLSRLQKKQKDIDRKADNHRKIELGGIIIAAGCDEWDKAELCGWLLIARDKRTDSLAAHAKERGLQHMKAREEARAEARKKKAS